MAKQVYILAAVRTPLGAFLGGLKDMPAPEMGGVAIRAAMERAGVEPSRVDEVLMGNVLQAGIGQAPARQAAFRAGIPKEVGATTINKVCGSGMKAVAMGCQAIAAGEAEIVVAGGMESMSRAPYLLEKARSGFRMGHGEVVDSMLKDGLVDAYHGLSMGECGEIVADHYGISREEQDRFAAESFVRARAAWERGAYAAEVVALAPVTGGAVERDECPARFDPDKMRRLRPAFREGGSITAANSSAISDGAAALVLASEGVAESGGHKPLARIIAHAQFGADPLRFGFAPAQAIRRTLEKTGLSTGEIDLFEINEAFAAIVLGTMRELGLDEAKVNVNGGAVALGHPIGATGARVMVTLVHALRERQGRYGIASLCLGGGEGMAVLVEKL